MAFTNVIESFVERRPALLALATIILSAGIAFTVTKSTTTTALRSQLMMELKSSSGSSVRVDGYSNVGFSGSLLVGDQNTGSGKLTVHGVDGSVFCIEDTDGSGWTSCDALNGTFTCRIARGAECP